MYWSRITCCRQWWPAIVRYIKFERVRSLQVKIEDHGLVYEVMECKVLWDKIGPIWSNVSYSGPVFLIVSRYDRLGPYFSLYYPFWSVLALSLRFDHISMKEALKRESGQKWSIIKQYEPLWRDMTNCGHIRHTISNSDQFSSSASQKAPYVLWRQLVAYTAKYGI